MEPTDPSVQLSPEASGIVDQLVDIAHDEVDPELGGIEWYIPDDEPPIDALDELQRAGICQHHRENESVVVNFTEAGRSRYV